MEFYEKLIRLRKKQGLTQQELAEAIDVSRQAISKWEVGAATPSTKNLRSLSKIFEVSLDDLVDGGELPSEECGAATDADGYRIAQREREVTEKTLRRKTAVPHLISLILLLAVIVLQAIPYGVSSQYLYFTGEKYLSLNLPKYSYFDLHPFLHGNFAPLISAIACTAAASILLLTLYRGEEKVNNCHLAVPISVLLSAGASAITLLICKTPLSAVITGVLTVILMLHLPFWKNRA